MIDVNYSMEEAEFAEANKLWSKDQIKQLPGRLPLQITGALFGGSIGFTFFYSPIWLCSAIVATYAAMYFIGKWRTKTLNKQIFRRHRDCWQNVNAQFDENGYRSERVGDSGGWIVWSAFSGWHEGNLTFVLRYYAGFIPVPKSALSPEQQAEFRTMLETRMRTSTTT